MEKAWLQREILIEQALCKVVSLWKRPVCKWNSFLKRLFVNRFIYGQMFFLIVVPLGTGSFQTGFFREKASLWNRLLAKGFPIGKGSF